MDKRPGPSDLILNRHDQQGSGEAVYASESRWKVPRFFKRYIEEEMADA